MGKDLKGTICQFYRLIPGIPAPQPADRSAHGTLPVNAYRYCEAVASASGFGWYLFPPMNFALMLIDDEVFWTDDKSSGWEPLRGVQFPDFRKRFAAMAPPDLADLAPPFLVPGSSPGAVQIWSGYLARTAPGWALLSRGVANYQKMQPYRNLEGIVETESWSGPLFTNIRLTRTNASVEFHMRRPLFQVQPVRQECYRNPAYEVVEAEEMRECDWARFAATVKPNTDQMRRLGHYAVAARKRQRRDFSDVEVEGCPQIVSEQV